MTNRRGYKESVYYWWRRVRKPTTVHKDGSSYRQRNYAVELYWAGQRINLTLGTVDRKEAAIRARRMWLYLAANGLEALRAKYRP